jgi:hypothetical protein
MQAKLTGPTPDSQLVDKARPAMVYVKMSNLSLDDLSTMDCWATPKEKSRLHQIENAWAAAHVSDSYKFKHSPAIPDPLILGNRVFGPTSDVSHGLQRRSGFKVKFLLNKTGDHKIHGTPCNQLFFKPIQVSHFMNEFHSTPVDCANNKVIDKLNAVLKGLLVYAATTKRTRPATIQAIVSKTADQLQVSVPGNTLASISLAEVVTSKTGVRLSHQNLPCIDIGTNGRHFYLPAEACKIVPNQPFSHLANYRPLLVDDKAFDFRTAKAKHIWKPKSAVHPYSGTKDDFELCFAEVIVLPQDVKHHDAAKHCHVPFDMWTNFQHEIGERFNGQLRAEVKDSTKIILPFRPEEDYPYTWEKAIQDGLGHVKGVRKVLIACIPGGPSNAIIHKTLRRLCDTKIGVQCNIVSVREILKRSRATNGPSPNALLQYTGAIVRKTLARARFPPDPLSIFQNEKTLEEHYGTKMEVAKTGLQIGIHVQRLQDIFDPQSVRYGTSDYYLVTVCSFAHAERSNKFSTGHYLISLKECQLNEKVRNCVEKHLQVAKCSIATDKKGKIKEKHVVFHRSGFAAEDRLLTSAEVYDLGFITQNRTGGFPDTVHLSWTEQPTAMLSQESAAITKNDVNCVVRRLSGANLVTKNGDTQLYHATETKVLEPEEDGAGQNLDNPFKLKRALHAVFIRSHDDIENSKKTYLVTHCHEVARKKEQSTFGALIESNCLETADLQEHKNKVEKFGYQIRAEGETELLDANKMQMHVFHSVLKVTTIPDILFLTQKAARYALKYVEQAPGQDVGKVKIPFSMPTIENALRNELYFL